MDLNYKTTKKHKIKLAPEGVDSCCKEVAILCLLSRL